jgi:large subunit ribosomal protein L7A
MGQGRECQSDICGGREEEGTEMVTDNSNKVAGAKQVKRAIKDGRAVKLYLADDADPRVTEPLAQLAAEKNVPTEIVHSMKELGTACGIAVGSAAAAEVRKI